MIFIDFSKVVIINMIVILIMSAKLAIPGLLKTKMFWNKGYDIIISVHDITDIILSRDLNHRVDAVSFNFNFNFIRIWPEKTIFLRSGLQVQYFGTGTRYSHEILQQCGKSVNTKSQRVLRTNSNVFRSYGGEAGRETLLQLHPE